MTNKNKKPVLETDTLRPMSYSLGQVLIGETLRTNEMAKFYIPFSQMSLVQSDMFYLKTLKVHRSFHDQGGYKICSRYNSSLLLFFGEKNVVIMNIYGRVAFFFKKDKKLFPLHVWKVKAYLQAPSHFSGYKSEEVNRIMSIVHKRFSGMKREESCLQFGFRLFDTECPSCGSRNLEGPEKVNRWECRECGETFLKEVD